LHGIVVVVDHDVDSALQAVFNECFNGRQFFFGYQGYEFPQSGGVFRKVDVEVVGLEIFPSEFLVLDPVLAEFNRVHLGDGGDRADADEGR